MKRDFRRGEYNYLSVVADSNEPVVCPLGDAHIGGAFDEELLLEWRREVRALGPKAVVLGMGDLFECALRDSPGASFYEQRLGVEEQLSWLKSFLEPLAPQIAGLLTGNHCYRLFKATGLDLMNQLCEHLKVPYLGWEVFGAVRGNGEHSGSVTFYAYHSKVVGKTGGLSANAVERDVLKWATVDLYLKAHGHDLGSLPATAWYAVDQANRKVQLRSRRIVLTGHFLKRSAYVAEGGSAPKPEGAMLLRLNLQRGSHGIFPEEFRKEDYNGRNSSDSGGSSGGGASEAVPEAQESYLLAGAYLDAAGAPGDGLSGSDGG